MAEDTSAGTGGNNSFYNIGYQTTKSELQADKTNFSGLDIAYQALQNRQNAILAEIKEEEKIKTDGRVAKGKELEAVISELDATMTSLGPESFAQAQREVEDLRNRMYEAIDNDDQKTIAELNIELKNIKQRHSADAENLTMTIDNWNNGLVSTSAMTDDAIDTYTSFAHAKKSGTAKEIYEGNPPVLHYQFPKVDESNQPIPQLDPFGEPMIGEDGNPVYEMHKYTLEDLEDLAVPIDTEGGEAYVDYVEAQSKVFNESGNPPTDYAIKQQIEKIIPKDEKKIRDWLWGDPAQTGKLDVQGYLFDILDGTHKISPENEYDLYKKLGVPEIGEPDGVYDETELQAMDKAAIVKSIMEVDDLNTSYQVITEIYTDIAKNNISGNEDLNKDYNKEKTTSLTNNVNLEETEQLKRDRILALYKDLEANPDKYRGYTKKKLAQEFDLTEADLAGVTTGEGNMINLDSILANPIEKKTQMTNQEFYNMIE